MVKIRLSVAARACAGPAAAVLMVCACASTALGQGSMITRHNFTDRIGGVHPSWNLYVDYYEDDSPFAPDFIGTDRTNVLGVSQAFWNEFEFDGQEWYNFNYAWSAGVALVRPVGGTVYTQRNPPTGWISVPTGGIVDVTQPTQDNTTYAGAARGILHPITFENNYWKNVIGATIPFIDVEYDSTTTGNNYIGNTRVRIAANSWCAWDVIGHEYGHHIQFNNGMDANPGGFHVIGDDNIRGNAVDMVPALGADQGTKLAWNEGNASIFFPLASREAGLSNFTFGAALPAEDGDTWYDNYQSTGSTATNANRRFNYDLETRGYNTRDAMGTFVSIAQKGAGEGDELSVQRVVWDYYDTTAYNENYPTAGRRDRVSFGAVDTWNQLMRNHVTFQQMWRDLTPLMGAAAGRAKVSGLTTNQKDEAVAALGEVLEEYAVSHIPTFGVVPGQGTFNTANRTPTLTFDEQNNDNSSFFRALVFSIDWSTLVWDSLLRNDATPLDPGGGMGSIIVGIALPNATYNWVILNDPAIFNANQAALADRYAWYWSGAMQFTVIPAPGAISLLAAAGILAARRRRRP